MARTDPCENDSAWSRRTNLCTKGGVIFYQQVQPRQTTQIIASTGNSKSWTRRFSVAGSHFMTIMVNI